MIQNVLCIADSCCDLIFGGLPKLPGPGEEIYGTHFSMQAGGGANTPAQLARLGVPVSFWTALGDDLPGRIVKDALEKSGVRLVRHGQSRSRTPVSAVLSTSEDRAFASYMDSGELIEDLAALEHAVRETDIVHTYLGYCTAYPIPELCARYGKELSLDLAFTDGRTERTEAVLAGCSYLKLNREEALRLSGMDTAEDALQVLTRMVKGSVVITLGADGSIGQEPGGPPVRQEAVYCGPFVDACGAGDAFAAGFLAGIARNMPFSGCMELGARLAGTCVTRYGGFSENTDGMHG